jgi:hypothetical protein
MTRSRIVAGQPCLLLAEENTEERNLS